MSWYRHTMRAQIFHSCTRMSPLASFSSQKKWCTRLIWILKFQFSYCSFVQYFAVIEFGLSIWIHFFGWHIQQPVKQSRKSAIQSQANKGMKENLMATHTNTFWPFINGRWVTYIRRRSRISSLVSVLCAVAMAVPIVMRTNQSVSTGQTHIHIRT